MLSHLRKRLAQDEEDKQTQRGFTQLSDANTFGSLSNEANEALRIGKFIYTIAWKEVRHVLFSVFVFTFVSHMGT